MIKQSWREVVLLLEKKGLTVALAESCTGGLVAAGLTDIPGASGVFECGVVCYSNRIKAQLLGVPQKTLDEHGAVSAETAEALARGVRKISGADIGVGITGFAGPTADEDGKPVGLIYIAADCRGSVSVHEMRTGETGADCRNKNRRLAADKAIEIITGAAVSLG